MQGYMKEGLWRAGQDQQALDSENLLQVIFQTDIILLNRENKSGVGTLPHTHNRSSTSDTSSYDEKCSLLVFVCLFQTMLFFFLFFPPRCYYLSLIK